MVHAENSDMISWMTADLAKRGMVSPWNHGTSRPPIVESEATNRVLALAELLDTPVLFVHVSAPDAFKVIREAQGRRMSVYAETCPHYLLLTGEAMRAPGFEGTLISFSSTFTLFSHLLVSHRCESVLRSTFAGESS